MKKSLKNVALVGMSALVLAAVTPTFAVFAEDTTAEETEAEGEEAEGEESEAEESEAESAAEGEESEAEESEAESAAEGEDASEASEGEEVAAGGLVLKQIYAAPHGDKSMASIVVALQGDKIVDVMIDEYQFVEGEDWTAVPSSDGEFGQGINEGLTLISKRQNSEGYSAMMTEKAGSTVAYDANLDAIGDFAKGKTTAELEAAIAELEGLGEDGNVSDVVSGATLVDTAGYLKSIVQAVNEGYEFVGAEAVESTELEIKQALAAPHGDKAFALVTVVMDGDKVAAASVDEFQIVQGDTWKGLPNKDGEFGKGVVEGSQLVSKLTDSEGYSALMTEKAGSTVAYEDNLKAISTFAVGKTLDEIKATVAELEGLGENGNVADVVSGATLVDAGGYLNAIVEVAQQ